MLIYNDPERDANVVILINEYGSIVGFFFLGNGINSKDKESTRDGVLWEDFFCGFLALGQNVVRFTFNRIHLFVHVKYIYELKFRCPEKPV